AEDGIRGFHVTGVQTCALPIFLLSLGNHEGSVGIGGDLPPVDERGEVGLGNGARRLEILRAGLSGELLEAFGRVFEEAIAEESCALPVKTEVRDHVAGRDLGKSEFDRVFSTIDLYLHSSSVFDGQTRPL